ncbi:hypothetical protein [Paenibacillus sp. NPDC057934]
MAGDDESLDESTPSAECGDEWLVEGIVWLVRFRMLFSYQK